MEPHFRLDTVVREMSEGKTFLFTFFPSAWKLFTPLGAVWHPRPLFSGAAASSPARSVELAQTTVFKV